MSQDPATLDDVLPTLVLAPGEGRPVDLANGDRVTVRISGEQTAGRFSLVEYEAVPGHRDVPLHLHPSYEEVWHVLEGVLALRIGDDVMMAQPGTTVMVPRNVPHTFWATGEGRVRALSVYAPAGFEQWFIRRTELLERGEATRENIARLAAQLDIVSLEANSSRIYNSEPA